VKTGVVFLETSALLRSLFGEEGAEGVREKLRSAERVFSSRLLRVEAERAILRLAAGGASAQVVADLERELRNTWPHIEMWEVSAEVCELAGRIAPRAKLRSLDAIHLATFHRLRQRVPAASMLTFDERLLQALTAGAHQL
jgi:predicted nucleic acid-binding protein